MVTIGQGWMWGVFALIVIAMLAVDLWLGGGRRHKVSVKEAGLWSLAWVTVALLFCAGLWWHLDGSVGRELANEYSLQFLAGYLLEKSLAVDNVFVWMLIFGFFAVPVELQRRVLLYGILGAVILRTIMIFAGSWLISQFGWVLYLFGAFLIVVGIKMLLPEKDTDLNDSRLLNWLRRHLRLTDTLEGERFLVMRDGIRYATPLLLALILVELSDVVFALDSIPAVFAVTTDPFLVLTSNLFAILGLRAMYFLLAGVADRFVLLKYGLAAIMVFIGGKMLAMHWFHVPVLISLSVIAGILVITLLGSLWFSRRQQARAGGPSA